MNCVRIAKKEEQDGSWAREHSPHGEPRKEYNKIQPPSYRLFRWVCPCGASLGDMEDLPEDVKDDQTLSG